MDRSMKPSKKGDYVVVDGKLYPVTGRIQQAAASGALCQAGRSSAAIERWDGDVWHRTWQTLHASASCATARGGGGGHAHRDVGA